MKALISRLSSDRANHYSGVYQIQGGMVTDADLGEASDIAKARVDELGDDAIGSGVPVQGGIVRLDNTARPTLQAGIVYADGVRGVVTATQALDATKPLDLYSHQQDLPQPPPLPAGSTVVYVDVWENPVTVLTDPHLVDAGLHGVETSFRTRTVAQIKAAPAADAAAIQAASGAYPHRGNAVLQAALTAAAGVVDPCDPCATEVAAAARVGNALFRLEVQDVQGPADHPTQITLLWSIENGVERYPTTPTPPAEFTQRAASVFEFFSKTTEAHKGVFASPATRHSSQVVTTGYPATAPNRTDGDVGPWPYARRWDGTATIALPLAIVGTPVNGAVAIDAGKVKITLAGITLTLDVAGKSVVTGDHWLVELREFAADPDKVRVESEQPIGIVHHYATLFTTAADGSVAPLPDADRRRASFPTLSDIPADHVSLHNTCPKLYGTAQNVQQALDELCNINAADITFTNNCPDKFDHATTVQQALDALCRLDLSPRLGYHLLFDWGVVCGVRVRLVGGDSPGVEISPGAILDRTGRLLVLPWDTPKVFRLGEIRLPDGPKPGTEYCLSLLIGDALDVTVHLVDKTDRNLVRPEDRTIQQVYTDCLNPHFKLGDAVKAQFTDSRSAVKDRFLLAVTGPQALASTLKLTLQEATEIGGATDAIIAQVRPQLTGDQAAALDAALATADANFNPAQAAGDAALFVRAQNVIAKFNAVVAAAPDPTVACSCLSYFPSCPDKDAGTPYVPIGCVTLQPSRIEIGAVCEFCCRRQALTPRTLRYWMRGVCCPAHGNTVKQPPFTFDPGKIIPGIGLAVPQNPIKWSPRPGVAELNQAAATEILRGHGVEVTQVVDIDTGDPLSLLADQGATVSAEDRIGSGGAINPGDSVALLMQGGVARDYVVLARGDGKYLFPTGTEKITPSVDMTLVDSRLAEAATARQALTGDIAALETRRNDLASQVVNLKSDVDRLSQSQVSLRQSLDAATTAKTALDHDVAALATQRDQLTQSVAGLRAGLDGMATQQAQIATAITGLQQQQQRLLQSIREAQPIAGAVGTNPALMAQLNQAGVATVGDFQRLPADQRDRLFAAANVPAADRARITGNVTRLITPEVDAMAKLHRRRRLPATKSKRTKRLHAAAEVNGAVKADLKEHMGGATAAHQKLAQHEVASAVPAAEPQHAKREAQGEAKGDASEG